MAESINMQSPDYSCIATSVYEERKEKRFAFFPDEIYDTKTTDTQNLLLQTIERTGGENVLLRAAFYDSVLKDKTKAIEEYQKAIQDHGQEPLPLAFGMQAPFTVEVFSRVRIAMCYQSLGQFRKAIEYYAGGYPWRRFDFEMAECFRLAGDQENARKMYLGAIGYHLSGQWASDPRLALRASLQIGDRQRVALCMSHIREKSTMTKEVMEAYLSTIKQCLVREAPQWAKELFTGATGVRP